MKTNNRPTIKLVEWEVRTKSDFLLWNSPDDTAIWDGERTGNTREVERPMNDTEYIEYLEKENQELKDNNEALAVEFNRLNEVLDKERQDQFLKVVESVFKEHRHSKLPAHPYPCDNCSKCGVILNNPNVKYTLPLWEEHILQEIKNAMKKEVNNVYTERTN